MDSAANKIEASYNPRNDAGIISKIFFFWINPLLFKGFKKDLEQHELYEALHSDRSDVLGSKLEAAWNEEVKKSENGQMNIQTPTEDRKPRLRMAFFRAFGHLLIPLGIICFLG